MCGNETVTARPAQMPIRQRVGQTLFVLLALFAIDYWFDGAWAPAALSATVAAVGTYVFAPRWFARSQALREGRY